MSVSFKLSTSNREALDQGALAGKTLWIVSHQKVYGDLQFDIAFYRLPIIQTFADSPAGNLLTRSSRFSSSFGTNLFESSFSVLAIGP